MIFDEWKLQHARECLKSLAALGYDLEITPYQLDTLDEMLKAWAEQEQLVNEHLRRVA